MKCWWCCIFVYSESNPFFTVDALSLISSHTTDASLITTGLSTCLLRTIQQNTSLTQTPGAGLIHPSPCGKVPLIASCAQGLYFHTSIMETLECSTANAQQVWPWWFVMLSDEGRSRWPTASEGVPLWQNSGIWIDVHYFSHYWEHIIVIFQCIST